MIVSDRAAALLAGSLVFGPGCGAVVKYDVDGWQTPSAETSESSDEGPVDVRIDEVRPAFGSTLGGSEITIVGGPFDRVADVSIGGRPASVRAVSETELVLVTPEGVEGNAELVVDSAGAIATHDFRYWPDASGLVGMKGTVAFIDVVGQYWASGNADRAVVEISLVEPVPYDTWQEYTARFGGCSADWSLPGDDPLADDGIGEVTLVSASAAVDLQADDGGWSGEAGVDPGEVYGIEPSGDWSGMTLDALAEVPVGLVVSEPRLDVDVPKRVDPGFDVTWDSDSPADYVAIVLEKSHFDMNAQAYVIDQKVSCAVPDTGTFTVPDLWSEWVRDDVVTVYVGRIREGQGVLPHNNSEIAVTGAYWVAGAVRAK